jgi:hypothetical protein
MLPTPCKTDIFCVHNPLAEIIVPIKANSGHCNTTANTGMIAKILDHKLEPGINNLHWTDARMADRQQAKPIEKVFRYVMI